MSPKRKVLLASSLCAIAILAPIVYALVAIQVFPPIPPSNSSFSAQCETLVADLVMVSPGSSGVVTFKCPGNNSAFSAEGTFTPTFTLPTGYTSLRIVAHLAGCDQIGFTLTSASPIGLVEAYDYCGNYANVPALGLGSFIIRWA